MPLARCRGGSQEARTPAGLLRSALEPPDRRSLPTAITVLRIEPGRRIGAFEDSVLERLVRTG
jgi:hypothetical protein